MRLDPTWPVMTAISAEARSAGLALAPTARDDGGRRVETLVASGVLLRLLNRLDILSILPGAEILQSPSLS